MYRLRMFAIALMLGCSTLLALAQKSKEDRLPALVKDPLGWKDLLPDDKFTGWKRVVLPPEKELISPSPWSVDRKRKVLVCKGAKAKEMLLHEKQRRDGIFHVEWRFVPKKGTPDYNSGVYVRCSPNGKIWHQAQVAQVNKAPQYGDLFGQTHVRGEIDSFLVHGKGHRFVTAPGTWNTYEITCKGEEISVWINGEVATQWEKCLIPKGCVGVQAEYHDIEFRNLKFKELK